jgi:ABC-2 type transport system ATP-binding protein
MEPFLSLQNIYKGFGSKKVLKGLSLDLYEGEILGLLGRSGCGKSTLIKVLVGYYHPSSGKIIFHGKEITKDYNEVRQIVGYTTQDNSFYEKLTVLENMKYYANLYNVPRKDRKKRISELLEAVKLDIAKDTLAGSISGGMKRRLDFALSLLHRPKLVILDEPTTGLDPVLVEKFWDIVTEVAKKEKITVLVSSHHLSEIKTYCTKAAIMADGQIKSVIRLKKNMRLDSQFKKLTK